MSSRSGLQKVKRRRWLLLWYNKEKKEERLEA